MSKSTRNASKAAAKAESLPPSESSRSPVNEFGTPKGDDPVAPPIAALVSRFSESLESLSFPQPDGPPIDAASLTLEMEAVRRGHAQVLEAQSSLGVLRAQLEHDQKRLLDNAKRALGYARVYAADRPATLERFEGIELEPRRLAPRKRRKHAAGSARAKQAAVPAQLPDSQMKLADESAA